MTKLYKHINDMLESDIPTDEERLVLRAAQEATRKGKLNARYRQWIYQIVRIYGYER